MHTDNRFLNDLGKLATGAAGAVQGLKQEVETMVRQRMERFLADLDLVQREEFEAVKEMARKAREDNESLMTRILNLETALQQQQDNSRRSAAPRKAPSKPVDSALKS